VSVITLVVILLTQIFYWQILPLYLLNSIVKGFLVAFDIFIIIVGAIFFLEVLTSLKIIENVGKDGYVEKENQLIIPFKDEILVIAKAVFEKEEGKNFDSNEKNLLKIFIANANNIIRNANLYTELESANRELIARNEDLKEANELNKKFLVISSHELRTPITLMSGYIQLLESKMYRGEEEKDKLYEGLKSSTQRLTKIVNNMLESFAISNRGKDIIFNKEHYDIEEIFNSVCEKVKPFKEARDISLILEKELGLPKIFTDKKKSRNCS
jgi:signal transduction histidine kinase